MKEQDRKRIVEKTHEYFQADPRVSGLCSQAEQLAKQLRESFVHGFFFYLSTKGETGLAATIIHGAVSDRDAAVIVKRLGKAALLHQARPESK